MAVSGYRWRRVIALQRLLFLIWGTESRQHRAPRVLIEK
jgi:hypothetical protein